MGVVWDLTLRGLRVTLVEMGDVGTGPPAATTVSFTRGLAT